MRTLIVAAALTLGAAPAPALADSPPCAARYAAAFSRLPSLAPRANDLNRATAEVGVLFGPRAERCEPAGYPAFVDAYRDFAREALRAPKTRRDPLLRLAIAAAAQSPRFVAADEAKAAGTLFRQMRSDLHATADDVGMYPFAQAVLEAVERAGPPAPEPSAPAPAPPPTPPTPASPTGDVQTIRVPTTPLPAAAIIAIYELRELLRQRDLAAVQQRVDVLIRAVEAAP